MIASHSCRPGIITERNTEPSRDKFTVKYKVLKSIAHNFTHSFVSFNNNYVDDGYVMDDLRHLARKANGDRIRIVWMPERGNEGLSPRVIKSIEHYKTGLERFVHAAGGDIAAIIEFRTEVYVKPNKQVAIERHIIDNRGRKYVSAVFNF